MKPILLVPALLLAAAPARAELAAGAHEQHAAPVLRGAPMSGPYTSAFDEKCAEIRAGAMRGEATCARVRALRVGGLRAEIHKVGWGDDSGDYYLALHTRDGWFVSDLPLQLEMSNGHAGHYDVGTIDSIALGEERLAGGPALSFQIRESWQTYCDECARPADRTRPTRSFSSSATMVCGVGAAGAPTCTAPLYTEGDGDQPPRIEAGKLIAKNVEVGDETEYGQEWHDLDDGRYLVEL